MSANDARHTVSRLAQLVERVTSNDEVSRSSRLVGKLFFQQPTALVHEMALLM